MDLPSPYPRIFISISIEKRYTKRVNVSDPDLISENPSIVARCKRQFTTAEYTSPGVSTLPGSSIYNLDGPKTYR